jgi:hypothetical protein
MERFYRRREASIGRAGVAQAASQKECQAGEGTLRSRHEHWREEQAPIPTWMRDRPVPVPGRPFYVEPDSTDRRLVRIPARLARAGAGNPADACPR